MGKTRLVIDGNAVYEIDEECMECRHRKSNQRSEEERKGKRPDKGRDKKQ